MHVTTRSTTDNAGFTLAELLIAMGIVLAIMGGTLTVMNDGYRMAESATNVIGLNNNLRIAVDLVVRDLIQVGQGMPTGRTVQVPNGGGALAIQRPHPLRTTPAQDSLCTAWPTDTTAISAVTVGPGCGPVINGVATDMVTTLAVDSALDAAGVQSFNVTARTATLSTAPVALSDRVRVGELMMFTKGSVSALAYVTAVSVNGLTFTFATTGDPTNLNQADATGRNGTVDDLAATPPVTANSASVSRIRMISYYLDNTLDPTTPRLIRHMNWGDPTAAVNQRGQTVAFSIENLQFTYDMLDGVSNPANVRMAAADLTAAGACNPNPCSPNQIRKVNVFLAGRSAQTFSVTKRFFRSTLTTQVSLRALALVDRYR
jgi:type II secretory pathway pseudopilin PulG